MIKTPYIVAWCLSLLITVWVDVHYASTIATCFTIAFLVLPVLLATALCGMKEEDDDEEDQ